MGLIGSTSSSDVVDLQKNSVNAVRRARIAARGAREYHVDLWLYVRRRWMVAGVLAAWLLAVLTPPQPPPAPDRRRGALYSQHLRLLWQLPLGYIYYSAGRRHAARAAPTRRLLALASAHSALTAPALAVLLLGAAQRSRVPIALMQGVLMSSVGSGCGWLSLAFCTEPAAAPVTALCHLVSLFTTPLAIILLCGRLELTVPTVGAVVPYVATLTAFCAGVVAARWLPPRHGGEGELVTRVCALLLLYKQCCEALQTRGAVRLEDVTAVLLLELCWLGSSAAACWGYARCGLLAPRDARLLALCALPRAHPPPPGWQRCGEGAALAQLAGVLLAPAQALLLAAIPDLPPGAAERRASASARSDARPVPDTDA